MEWFELCLQQEGRQVCEKVTIFLNTPSSCFSFNTTFLILLVDSVPTIYIYLFLLIDLAKALRMAKLQHDLMDGIGAGEDP